MDIRSQQRALAMLTLYQGAIDGIEGGKTQAARAAFLERQKIKDASDLTETLKLKIFTLPFDQYQHPDDLAATVKAVCQSIYYDDPRIWAYIMATVQHETNGTYYPVVEYYYAPTEQKRLAYLSQKRYYPYYGRGLVQITWDYNYRKYQDILNNGMLNNPDAALDPPTSLFILIHGMLTGNFTGLALKDFINKHECDYKGARKTVNGNDKDQLIAGYAQAWEKHYGLK